MKAKDKAVSLEVMNPAMWPMAQRVDHVYREELGYELIINSGSEPDPDPDEPVHKEGSFHYPENTPDKMGRAIDCRTWTTASSGIQLTGLVRERFYERIKRAAGKNFQVVNESDHFHIELDR